MRKKMSAVLNNRGYCTSTHRKVVLLSQIQQSLLDTSAEATHETFECQALMRNTANCRGGCHETCAMLPSTRDLRPKSSKSWRKCEVTLSSTTSFTCEPPSPHSSLQQSRRGRPSYLRKLSQQPRKN